jgi:hypothetical protein
MIALIPLDRQPAGVGAKSELLGIGGMRRSTSS